MKTFKTAMMMGVAAMVAVAGNGETIVYQDVFDNDGLYVNSGIGGGMGTYSRQGGPFVDDGVLDPQASAHNDRGNVYSLGDFDLFGGFKLEVSYDVDDVSSISASRVNIGLVDASVDFSSQDDSFYISDFLRTAAQCGIGMDLTASDGDQGLAYSDGASVTQLSSIAFGTGTHSFVLEVEADSCWSYSIDGGTAVTGTIVGGFNFGQAYKFFVYVQDTENGFSMNSVTLTAKSDRLTETLEALSELENHLLGSTPLTGSEIALDMYTITNNAGLFASNTTVIAAGFDLVEAYDAEEGALWLSGSSVQSFDRTTVSDEDIDWVVYNVMQTIMDETYTVANVAANASFLDGKLFGCSAGFPGSVSAPVTATNTVTINASYPEDEAWPRSGEGIYARKPTGNYVAPGTIATVAVP
ncbi:hypothetical protein, partial [Pontiella sp.]